MAAAPDANDAEVVDALCALGYEPLQAELLMVFVPLGLARPVIRRLPFSVTLLDHVLVLRAGETFEVPLKLVPEFVEARRLGEETFETGIIPRDALSAAVQHSVEMNLVNQALNAGTTPEYIAAPVLIRLGDTPGFEDWYSDIKRKTGSRWMRFKRRWLVVCACIALIVTPRAQVCVYAKATPQSSPIAESQRRVGHVIVAEEPESSDPKEREVRRAKNTRYNAGGTDLTIELPENSEIFFEHIWPAVDFFPAAESAIVVVGRVEKVQPHLSTDRSRIYTEFTIAVDDFLKRNRIPASKTVAIDRPGGALKLKNGRIVRDGTQIDYLGNLEFGRRYVIFARAINDGNDLSLIKSYELDDGKVFSNDSRPRRLISPSDDEARFLREVREAIKSSKQTGTR